MKRLLLICLVFLGVALTVKANGEPDFASKYLMLYGQTYDIRTERLPGEDAL